MRASIATICLLAGALLAGGCATKKYVRNTTAPIQAKVDQVGEQSTQNSQHIQETRDQVKSVDEKATNGISAAQERANSADQHAAAADQHAATADQHAGEAMTKANAADQKGDKNGREISTLRSVVANLDDYKLQTSVTVPFGFDKAVLSKEAKDDLDKFATQIQNGKRYFIAVEGYTDSTGSKSYNEMLSKRRADAVVHYLVSKHNLPIYKINMIGLGQEKPVDEAKGRDARAKNRRVEVKVFSADQATAALNTDASSANRDRQQQ
jgi:outer membrane protein OmpA-like peptidoglycan-associated protein